jgi:hypothetical protein
MKIDFEVETAHGKFADALYFEANAVPDDATIEALKQERVDNWIASITAPSTHEYVELDGVLYEKIQLEGQVVLKPVGA